ncbi:MAG: hypothetical protein ACR2FY_24235 [Pirellulaceae bacterium]
MSRFVVTAIVATVGLLVVVDSASAGIFGRRWERRRESLRSELDASLSGKLQAGVAQESAAAETRVKEASQAQIAGEAQKLQDQVSGEIADLRRKAAEQVAAEAKRLEALTAEQVKALQAATQQQLAAEVKKLQDQIKGEFAKVRDENAKQVDALAVKLREENKVAGEAQAKLVQAELAKVPEFVSAEGKKLKETVMPELKAAVVEAVSAIKPEVKLETKPNDARPEEKKDEKQQEEGTLSPPPPSVKTEEKKEE